MEKEDKQGKKHDFFFFFLPFFFFFFNPMCQGLAFIYFFLNPLASIPAGNSDQQGEVLFFRRNVLREG